MQMVLPRARWWVRALVALAVAFLALTTFSRHAPDSARALMTAWGSTHETEASIPVYTIPPIPTFCNAALPPSSVDPSATSPELATPLSAKDLLCRPVDAVSGNIPRLFHQSWKTTELPVKFQEWSRSCRQAHRDWEWVLWTDDDNLELVRTYFPSLESTYSGLPGAIYRADFARNLYMYMFGGVYADLDVECLQPTDKGLDPFNVSVDRGSDPNNRDTPDGVAVAVLGRMGQDVKFQESIPNAWMAASPRHPFFVLPLEQAQNEVRQSTTFLHSLWHSFPSPESLTGPAALHRALRQWNRLKRKSHNVVVLPADIIYPYDWHDDQMQSICLATSDTFDEELCKQSLQVRKKGSLTITYWSHTHKGKQSNAKNIEKISRRI